MAMSPWEVLGVEQNASEQEIRAAYLRMVKRFPPDSSPTEFEQVRDAYDGLRDSKARVLRLMEADPMDPLPNLLTTAERTRTFVGPEPWIQAIEEGRRGK
ncbi:MAG: J domain-containing protein [Acidobacteria bacterium]|nr:J domain-containing protein [Acidobacteriota bacterium]